MKTKHEQHTPATLCEGTMVRGPILSGITVHDWDRTKPVGGKAELLKQLNQVLSGHFHKGQQAPDDYKL